jgi:hypothetical protein
MIMPCTLLSILATNTLNMMLLFSEIGKELWGHSSNVNLKNKKACTEN